MNYYIDFDNTLYETARLTKFMMQAVSRAISEETGKNEKEILEDVTANFDSTNDNIYSFAEKMCKKHGGSAQSAIDKVNAVLDKGGKLVFPDAKNFLKRLKKNGDKCYILTFLPKTNQEYQMRKVIGSGISSHFDGVIMTTQYKFLLDLNYENGIFIDDDPRDLNGLLARNPIKVIRMKKPSNRRSKIRMNEPRIEEYESFDDIELIPNKDEREK